MKSYKLVTWNGQGRRMVEIIRSRSPLLVYVLGVRRLSAGAAGYRVRRVG
jgi:hypothetical protein